MACMTDDYAAWYVNTHTNLNTCVVFCICKQLFLCLVNKRNCYYYTMVMITRLTICFTVFRIGGDLLTLGTFADCDG